MRGNRADAENVARIGEAADLHKKSWDYARKVRALFANNPNDSRRVCKLIDYAEDDGTMAQIGQCNVGFRSGMWPQLDLIYDPTGQVALPGYRRTVAWKLAVEEAFCGGWLVKSSDAGQHVIGDFCLIRLYPASA